MAHNTNRNRVFLSITFSSFQLFALVVWDIDARLSQLNTLVHRYTFALQTPLYLSYRLQLKISIMAESSNLNEQKPPVVSDDHTAKSTADAAAAPSSNPGSEASPETVMSVNTPAFIPETSAVILERLARQVEYYFSTANLERDTYVSTLRSLNDGYVPLAIIANFGKVKAMVSYDALNAVRRAAMDFSELLEVVHIDTQTGKRLDAEAVSTSPDIQTVEAVGPRSGEPIPMSSIVTAPVSSPVVITQVNTAPSVQNTLIIREVPEGTQESHIRELFTFEKCPQIQSLHLDVANCWYVIQNWLNECHWILFC
jgi:hypothetical protein